MTFFLVVLCGVIAGLSVSLIYKSKLLKEAQNNNKNNANELIKIQEEKNFLAQQNAELKGRLDALIQSSKTEEQIKEQLKEQFKLVSNDILDAQKQKFKEEQNAVYDNTFKSFRDEIKNCKEQMEKVKESNTITTATIKEKIENLEKNNTAIQQTTEDLINAFRGNKKQQGNIGEDQLKTLFESFGMINGVHFAEQDIAKDEENKRKIPDYVLFLPDDKFLIVDSKYSLENYLKYTQTGENKYLDEYCKNIISHIRELNKNYIEVFEKKYNKKSIKSVFMFVPLEMAYLDAINYKSISILQEALKNNVSIVTASSLLPVVQMINELWSLAQTNKNYDEIIKRVDNIVKQVENFVNESDNVKNILENAKVKYEEALKKLNGQQGILTQANKIQDLQKKQTITPKDVNNSMFLEK